MNISQDKQPLKSPSYDTSNDQERAEKSRKGSGSAQPQNKASKLHLDDSKTICSDTSIYSQELEDLPWQQSNLGEYKQPSLLKSIPTHKQSCDKPNGMASLRTSPESPFTQTSETISQSQDNLTSSQWDSPALGH